MATVLAALESRPRVATAFPLRLLHGWHLFSLDAPTVALVWTLVFARAAGLPRAVPVALALSCAVWLIYVADRVLDAFAVTGALGLLHQRYRDHMRGFACAGMAVALLLAALLTVLPRPVLLGWIALAFPLLLYALAVHWVGLASRWKPWCIGVFFAMAVVVPCLAMHRGDRGAVICGAVAFGGLCCSNCAVLQGKRSDLGWAAAFFAAAVFVAHRQPVVLIVVVCYGLLLGLCRQRESLHPLTFRALADAALVLPALVWLAR